MVSSFHLFQRVVGFRHMDSVVYVYSDGTRFPSLSESSGFPTDLTVYCEVEKTDEFPSLSESSGFPTTNTV